MAFAIAHALVGIALGTLLVRPRWLWTAGAACAVVPDADMAASGSGSPTAISSATVASRTRSPSRWRSPA